MEYDYSDALWGAAILLVFAVLIIFPFFAFFKEQAEVGGGQS